MNFKMKRILIFICFIFLHGCNNPLDRSYSSASFEKDIQDIRKNSDITDQQMQNLSQFVLLARIAGNKLEGETYKSILDRIGSLQQTTNAKEMEIETRRNRLASWCRVELVSKEYSIIKEKPFLVYTISFTNISSQKITMIVGNLTFQDLLEKPIKVIDIFFDEKISPGLSLTKTYQFPYNNADENDQRIRTKDVVDMRVVWNPEKVVLADGKILQ